MLGLLRLRPETSTPTTVNEEPYFCERARRSFGNKDGHNAALLCGYQLKTELWSKLREETSSRL